MYLMKKIFKKIPPSEATRILPMAGNQPPAPPSRGVRETFAAFYESWLAKHQEFQEKLLECLEKEEETECTELITEVLCHYEEFFNEKCKAANDDIFLVMSPPWFTSLELTLTWISSFKPTTFFTLITKLDDLSSDQTDKIDGIKSETRKLEKELEEKLAKVQESVAGGNGGFGVLIRRYGSLMDGGDEMSELDKTMDELKASMMTVVKNADGLRQSTAKKIMEVLKPLQNVKLLASFGQLLVRARRLGKQKDAQRAITSNHEASTTSHA